MGHVRQVISISSAKVAKDGVGCDQHPIVDLDLRQCSSNANYCRYNTSAISSTLNGLNPLDDVTQSANWNDSEAAPTIHNKVLVSVYSITRSIAVHFIDLLRILCVHGQTSAGLFILTDKNRCINPSIFFLCIYLEFVGKLVMPFVLRFITSTVHLFQTAGQFVPFISFIPSGSGGHFAQKESKSAQKKKIDK